MADDGNAEIVLTTDASMMRSMFNEMGYMRLVESHQLNMFVRECRHRTRHYPWCSYSAVLEIFNGDEKLVTFHQYWPSNGPRTKPDPKFVKYQGKYYRLIV